MAETSNTPVRKRPVSTSRNVADKRPSAKRVAETPAAKPTGFRAARSAYVADAEPETPNYALRLTEGIDDDDDNPIVDDSGFATRLNAALEAISAAQQASSDEVPACAPSERATRNAQRATLTGLIATLDKLPPIRLPIGPAIPWRLGLPALVAAVVLMGVMSRSAARADAPGVQLPAQQTYAVQQEAPLFAKPQPTETAQTAQDSPKAASLGVQDPGLGFDPGDLAIKLIAVLALAYGSLMVLRRFGVGGVVGVKTGGAGQSMRVVSSLALAPNRSVHVIKVPGGRTLLVGATPTSVNLLADLGVLADDQAPEAASLLDALKSRVGN